MTEPAQRLDTARRGAVRDAATELAVERGWVLMALNVRTNHVHLVIAASERPEQILAAIKAAATLRAKRAGLVDVEAKLWTRNGSTRYLWRASDVEAAIDYVKYRQGPDLP